MCKYVDENLKNSLTYIFNNTWPYHAIVMVLSEVYNNLIDLGNIHILLVGSTYERNTDVLELEYFIQKASNM